MVVRESWALIRIQTMTKPATLQIPRQLVEIARPAGCALVVYDMQAGILSQLPHGREIRGKVLEVLEIARSHGFPTFFMRHMSLPTKLAGRFQLRQPTARQQADSPEAAQPGC